MDHEFILLRAEFWAFFVVSLVVVAGTAADIRLIGINQVGGHTVVAYGSAFLGVVIGFFTIRLAWRKRQEFRSIYGVHRQAPFGSRDNYVDPEDAVRDIGGAAATRQAAGPRRSSQVGGPRDDRRRLG